MVAPRIVERGAAGFDGDGSSLAVRLRSLRPWQMALLVVFAVMPLVAVMLMLWLGLTVLLNSDPAHQVSAEATLNLLLVVFVAVPGFLLMHKAQYRWFWHLDRSCATRRCRAEFGSEPTAKQPTMAWPVVLRLRHAAMYVFGMAVLITTFAPYQHQISIAHWLSRYSAGGASRGSLSGIVFVYLPMVVFAAFAILLTYRQLRRRDAGALNAGQMLLLEAETNWLFSFALTFGVASLLCRVAGSMILSNLR